MAGGSVDTAIAGTHEIAYGPPGYKGLIKEPRLFALACFASIGGLLFGYDQGVISGVLVMNNFSKHFPILTEDAALQGWLVSIMTLGAMFGAFVNGPISDRLSRRWSILCANITFLAGSVVQCAAENVAMLFVGRLVFGCAVGMLAMVVPLYLSELAPPNIRGALVALQQLSITVGIMSSFWINYGTQYIGGTGAGQSQAAWRIPFALQCVPSAILAIGTFFLPYSPRWLMNQGREDEVLQTLVRLRRVPLTDHRLTIEFLEIKAARLFDQETKIDKYGEGVSEFYVAMQQYKELFTVGHLRKRTMVACLLQVLQQFTGINAIIYYAPQFFEAIGLSGNSVNLLATGVVGIVFFFSTIPAVMYLDRWGRRKTLMLGAAGMSVAQLVVATLYAVYKTTFSQHPAAGWTACVFVWIYIGTFAFSIACVNWIMPSEMFPPATRGKAVGVAIASNYLSNFIVALITPRMLESITFGTFYFFLVFCITLGVWTYFCVPETKGVPIEKMDKLFGGNDAQADLERIAEIRCRIGLMSDADTDVILKESKDITTHIEDTSVKHYA
ncbi:general substrate transporter [Aspergillus sergii]|uniref:General substrate transporter n=1 Tax=Aspergillus sergii TaxID=1034303 RepID=A0A5N6WMZ8_9EURO|nr:general substrate transporter [Aspergillus sergii]